MPSNKIVCYTLKTARERVGLKQREAANSLGISTDTLRNYEQGKKYPDVRMVPKFEALYHVSYDQLLFLPDNFG